MKAALQRGPERKRTEKLPMVFEVAGFPRAEDAVEAVKVVQNTMRYGRVVRLQVSKLSNTHGAGDV